jgi:alkaline phosphatase D
MGDEGFVRREFIRRTAGLMLSGAGTLAAGRVFGQAPAIVTRDGARPSIAFGATAGDVDGERAIIWSRTDRAARLLVEYSTTESFTSVTRVTGDAALETSDYTARVDLSGLPSAQRIFYRVRFERLNDARVSSAPITATFTTPARVERAGDRMNDFSGASVGGDVTIAWTADTAGQGWGINPDVGGMRLYDAMHQVGADLFVHCGDTIYADQPIQAEVTLDDGRVWRNVVTPEKSKVAETLDEFRGNYRYNLLDEHVRRFNASVAQFVIWDDHEVVDNWYPGEALGASARHAERRVDVLAARARRAFLEYTPIRLDRSSPERVYRACRYGPLVEVFGFDMRSYRGPNSANRQSTLSAESSILGATQVEWLKRRLAASTATWKIIASDMPLGLVVADGPEAFEAIANRDDGPPLGRELEIAGLLTFIRDRVRNVVFITGDVHYCAAHHFDPARARFTEFSPFWEFVAGPAHAGTFGPGQLDRTFGPEVRFIGIPAGMKPNRPPSEGLQFFGTLRVDAKTHALTARLHNAAGETLFTLELPPDRAPGSSNRD